MTPSKLFLKMLPSEGEIFKNPLLAKTYKTIAKEGSHMKRFFVINLSLCDFMKG